MGLFSGRKKGLLPANTIELMTVFGKAEYDGAKYGIDAQTAWDCQSPLLPIAQAEPEKFVEELAAVVVPAGGWAAYGADRTLMNLLGVTHEWQRLPAYGSILNGSLEFLRQNQVPPLRIAPYQWEYWVGQGGKRENWLPTKHAPADQPGLITDILPGTARRIAQLDSAEDSKVIYAYQSQDGIYGTLVEEHDDATGQRIKQATMLKKPTLYEVYCQLGAGLQAPVHWVDTELEPFFPYSRPLI